MMFRLSSKRVRIIQNPSVNVNEFIFFPVVLGFAKPSETALC